MNATPRLTYPAAVAELQRRGRFGIRLGLGRTLALLRALGDPHLQIRGALVAGTNGKGSVLALAGSVLRGAGLRVGETPKPHLVSYRERLQVGGRPIEPDEFASLVADALPIADRVARRHGDPTEFELLTALAFRWFADQHVDLALVEVGLGGRLDATNAWDGGVAVVTNVTLDHMDRLGDTIPDIAREKAAIIKRGDRAVTGAEGAALDVVRRRARRVAAPLCEVPIPPILEIDRDGLLVDLPRLGPTRVGLRGRHQAHNVAVADATLDALAEVGVASVTDEQRQTGYATARWAGRLELIAADPLRGHPQVLLDGAHNLAGATALARALDDMLPTLAGTGAASGDARAVTLLTGMMADKDVTGVGRELAASDSLAGARVIATQVEGARPLPAAELAAVWARLGRARDVVAEPSLEAALTRGLAQTDGTLVVAGSLYLVGAVRARLIDDPRLRDPGADSAP